MSTTTTTFTVAASADDGFVSVATSSSTIPTSGWGSPSNSGASMVIGGQEDYSYWPNIYTHYLGYFRFQNITVAQGATISSAYLKPYQSSSSSKTLTVKGLDKDNASAPSGGSELASSNFTSAGITDFASGTGAGQKTSPDIKTIIQEIVNRAGWSSGNAMMLAVYTTSWSGIWNARSYDYSSASEAAQLVIEYSSGSSTPIAAISMNHYRQQRI